jgi:hypothetical protein
MSVPTGYYKRPGLFGVGSPNAQAPDNAEYFQRYGLNSDPNYQPITGYQNMSYADATNQGYSPAMSEAAARGQGVPQYTPASAPNVEDQANLRRRESQGDGAGLFAAGLAGMFGTAGLMGAGGAGGAAGTGATAAAAPTTATAAGTGAIGGSAGAAAGGIPAGMEGVTVVGSSGGGAGGLIGAGSAGAGAGAAEGAQANSGNNNSWKRYARMGQQMQGQQGQQQQQQSPVRIWTNPATQYVSTDQQRKQRLLSQALLAQAQKNART